MGNHMISILQGKEKYCYITGETENLEKHHIYFGSRRKTSDKYGFWVWLTPEMHRGTNGVHGKNGHEIDIFLKTECQKKFEETNDHDTFMKLIGRNYIEIDNTM